MIVILFLFILALFYVYKQRKEDKGMVQESYELQKLNKKIDSLEKRIAALESQMQSAEVPVQEMENEPTEELVEAPVVDTQAWDKEPVVEAEVIPDAEAIASEHNKNTINKPTHASSSGWSEKHIGKTLMSIVASLLIFIGFVRFGSIILNNLTDTMKVCIMYAISVAVAVFGLVKMRKEGKYRVLYTALASCGLGAFYITSLVSHFVFNQLSEYALLGIIAAWIALLVTLSRHRNLVFSIICNIGIVIATVLSVFEWSSSVIGLVLYCVSIGALYAVSKTKELKSDWWLVGQFPIVCGLMLNMYSDNNVSICCVAAAVIFALVWQLRYYSINASNSLIFLINTLVPYLVVSVCAWLVYNNTFDSENSTNSPIPYIVLAAIVIVWCAYYYKHFVSTTLSYLFYSVYFIAVIHVPMLNYGEFYSDYIGLLLPAIALTALGTLLSNRAFRYAGYLYLVVNITDCPDKMPLGMEYAIYALIMAYLVRWLIRHYAPTEKYILTLLAFYFVCTLMLHNIIDPNLMYVLAAGISLFANSKLYATHPHTKAFEPSSRNAGYLTNAIMLFAGMMLIHWSKEPIRIVNVIEGTESINLLLIIMTTIALAFVNTNRLYHNGWDERYASIYICIKFTLLVWTILSRIDAMEFVISVVGIALAVLFVILGFKFRLKTFRLYGLALSIICVLKLAIFDIEYSTSIMKPIGFFVAGALCYSISWMYSRLEKSLN